MTIDEELKQYENSDIQCKDLDGYDLYPTFNCVEGDLVRLLFRMKDRIPNLDEMKVKDVASIIRGLGVRDLLIMAASQISSENDEYSPVVWEWEASDSKLTLFDGTGDGICRVHVSTYCPDDERLAEFVMEFGEDECKVDVRTLDEDYDPPEEGRLCDLCNDVANHVKSKVKKLKYEDFDRDYVLNSVASYSDDDLFSYIAYEYEN